MARKAKSSSATAERPAARVRHAGDGQGSEWTQTLTVCCGIVAVIVFIYAQASGFGVIGIDDTAFTTENFVVQAGLTEPGVRYAFVSTSMGSWHPLTWLSHMLDYSLFGDDLGSHHWTSITLHAANSLLLFFLLRTMTRAVSCSALVALLFAVHPMHVEPVVWLGDRKGVLSALFWMLGCLAWVRSVRLPEARWRWHAAALGCYALGLMTKPTVITLPLALVLLEYWPLQRWSRLSQLPRILAEKAGFFALAIAGAIVTYQGQRGAGAMDLYGHLSLPARLANAVNSLAFYLWKTFWPVDLAFNYTLGELSVAAVIVPLVAIALITTLVIHRWRAAPYLAVGWFWFVGVLVPTLGLIQTGDQAHADRYSYLPHAGLFVAVVWGLYENLKPEWRAKMRIRGGTAAVLFALTLLAWIQTSYWRGPIPFWERTLAVVPHHVQGLQLYGEALTLAKKFDQAEPHLRKAVQLRPKDPGGHRKLAQFYFQQGKHPEALAALDTAIGLAPESATAHYDRALVLRESGRLTEAITWFEKAIALGLQPNAHMDALFHLGRVHSKLRQQDYAAAYYLKMLALDPRHYLARKNLAYAYMDLRKYVEAEREFTTLYQYNERDEDVIRSLRFLRNRK